MSDDDGKNWDRYLTYAPGKGEFTGYSDIAKVKKGIGVLFEWGENYNVKNKHKRYWVSLEEYYNQLGYQQTQFNICEIYKLIEMLPNVTNICTFS